MTAYGTFVLPMALFFSISIFLSGNVLADDDVEETKNVVPGFYKQKQVVGGAANAINAASINVAPHSGSLQVAHTDFYLPGSGGMDLTLARFYQTIQPNEKGQYGFDTNYDFSPVGIGWSMHFGMIKVNQPGQMCSTTLRANISNNPVYIAPDGSQRILAVGADAHTANGPDVIEVDREYFTYVTKQFDVVFCKGFDDPDPANDEIWMRTPDGRRYGFTQRYYDQAIHSPAVWYVNSIADPNGNSINISYINSGVAGNEGVLIDSVSTSDGKTVDFLYTSPGSDAPRLTAIEYDGDRWEYEYEQSSVDDFFNQYKNYNLIKATSPDGDVWEYEYDETSNLTRIKNPYGGSSEISYEIKEIHRFDLESAIYNKVVTKLKQPGKNTYNYSYQKGSSGDTTTVSDDMGVRKYYYEGLKSISDGSVWKIGVLKKETYSPNKGPSSETIFSYSRQPVSTENSISRVRDGFDIPEDEFYYLPLKTSETFTLGSDVWTKNYSWSLGSALGDDDFILIAPPVISSIAESGPGGAREIGMGYFYARDKYIYGLHEGTGVKDGGRTYAKVAKTFNADGKLIGLNNRGAQINYTLDGDGNIRSAVTAEGVKTDYSEHKFGVSGKEKTPSGLTISYEVDAYGRVAKKTYEGRSRSVERDVAGRIQSISPVAGDGTSVSWSKKSFSVTKGGMVHSYSMDDYGRVISEEISGEGIESVDISRTYDAHSNLVELRINGSVIDYEYDGYDRLIKVDDNGAVRKFNYSGSAIAVTNEVGGIVTYPIRSFSGPNDYEVMGYEEQGGISIAIERNLWGGVTSIVSGDIERNYEYSGGNALVPISYSEPETGVTEYSYDSDLRVIGKNYYGNDGAFFRAQETVYDSSGRAESVKTWNAAKEIQVNFSYNSLDEILSVEKLGYSKTDSGLGLEDSLETRYQYTLDGLVSKRSLLVDDKSFIFEYVYDESRAIDSVTYPSGNQYSLNNNSLGLPLSYSGFVSSVGYDYTGAPRFIEYANGDVYTSELNDRRIVEAMNIVNGASSLLSVNYSYDAANNILSIVDSLSQGRSLTATYDDYSRMVTADYFGKSYGYVYDAVSNISLVTIDQDFYGFNYDQNNHLTQADVYGDDVFKSNASGEVVYFGSDDLDGTVEPGFRSRRYARNPDGTIAAIVSNSFYDMAGHHDFYWYDHRGYLVKEQSKRIDQSSCNLGSCDYVDLEEPIYHVYGESGRLLYQFDSNTDFKKEYHYLNGRLVGVIADDYACADDPDEDGMGYCFENEHGLDNESDDSSYDYDNDGLTNLEEFQALTNPYSSDTDLDGIPDEDEIQLSLNPLEDDASADNDGDGFTNYQEYRGGYDPNVANVPDPISSFSVSSNGASLRVTWDATVSPSVRMLAGEQTASLSEVGIYEGGEAVIPFSALSQEGYIALTAFNLLGDASVSGEMVYSSKNEWGSLSVENHGDLAVYMDQQGMALVIDSDDVYLKVVRDGQVYAQTALNPYPLPESVDYQNDMFQTFRLSNGDLIIVWTSDNKKRHIMAARFCVSEMAFCAKETLYSSNYFNSGTGEYIDAIKMMKAAVVDDALIVGWKQKKAASSRALYTVVADLNLDDFRTYKIGEGDEMIQGVSDYEIVASSSGSVLLLQLACCDSNQRSVLYEHEWLKESGWQNPEVVNILGSSAPLIDVDSFDLVKTGSGAAAIVAVDSGEKQLKAASMQDGDWQWLAGSIDLTGSVIWYGWQADAVNDDLYLAFHAENGANAYVSPNFSVEPLAATADLIPLDSAETVSLNIDSNGAGILVSDDLVARYGDLDSNGLQGVHWLPVSGGRAAFVEPSNDNYFTAIAARGENGVASATVSDYQNHSLPSDSAGVQNNLSADEAIAGQLVTLCANWSLSGFADNAILSSVSGPVFGELPVSQPCQKVLVPYLPTAEIASVAVVMETASGDISGQGDVPIAAFEPSVSVWGPATIEEGQQALLEVDIAHGENEYFGDVSVSWTQLSGPERSVSRENSSGSQATLWGSNVAENSTAVYRADVYFPEADLTVSAQYAVEILDTGDTVDLPPEISLSIVPYSAYDYDMQKVTIETDVSSDISMRLYGSWSMLSDGNQPQEIPSGQEPEPGFNRAYVGPFSAILNSGQEIQGRVRAESTSSGLVSYYDFVVKPLPVGPLEPVVIITGSDTVPDGSPVTFTADTYANDSGAVYDGQVDYLWTQTSGPDIGLGAGVSNQQLQFTPVEVVGPMQLTLQVEANLVDEGMSVTTQHTFDVVDDESSSGQPPTISWTVEPYSNYGYDMNRVTIDAGNSAVHMKVYGSWTMLSDGNQPVQVPAGSEPESGYGYEFVGPFSILREAGKEMDITIRAQSNDSGLVSYDRVIVDENGGTAAAVN